MKILWIERNIFWLCPIRKIYRIHVRLAWWILWVLFDNVTKAGMWVLIIIYNGDETILLCAYLSEESTSRNIVVSSTKRYFVRSSYIRYTQYPKPFFHVKVDSGQFLFFSIQLVNAYHFSFFNIDNGMKCHTYRF